MRGRGTTRAKDPKAESMDMMSRMARKRGTANDWVNQVLDGAIRSRFMTTSEEEALERRRGGETRREREKRLSHLYDASASSKLVRRRAKVIREPKPKNPREMSMVDFNPYGSVDDGPMYKVEERKSASSPTQPWVVGYRNSPSSPIVSPMGKNSQVWLEKQYGTVLSRDLSPTTTPPPHEPWSPPLKGSPHLWPKDANYAGAAVKSPTFCQPFRPSSRLANTSYATLHTVPPKTGLTHPDSLSNTRGPTRGFTSSSKPKSPGTTAEGPARKMDFDRSQTAAIKEAFKSRTLPSRGLPQGSSPHSTLRDGDSYVMGSPTRDDDGWTWNSDIGSPVKRVSDRTKRWYERQAQAEVAMKKRIRQKQRRMLRMSRTQSAPSPLKDASRRSSTRSHASKASTRSTRRSKMRPAGETEPKQGLKYWTGFTVMYSTRQDEKTIKARAQKRAKEREMRAKIKWRELGGLFAYLRMPSRRQPGVDELQTLHQSLRKACAELGTEATITRDRFWQLISGTELPQLHANRLFSGFDVDRRDELDVRKFMCSLRLFKKPNEPLMDKLASCFDIYHTHSSTEYLRRADVISLLQVCADMEMEVDMMEKLAIRAMNSKFGNKSVWAMDVSREGFKAMLAESEMLMSTFTHQYAATVAAV